MGLMKNLSTKNQKLYSESERDRRRRARKLREEFKKREIERLKSMTYYEYLATEHWQQMRKKAFKHYGKKCKYCGCGNDLNVHHVTYERRGDERLEDLEIVCQDCHKRIHNIH